MVIGVWDWSLRKSPVDSKSVFISIVEWHLKCLPFKLAEVAKLAFRPVRILCYFAFYDSVVHCLVRFISSGQCVFTDHSSH